MRNFIIVINLAVLFGITSIFSKYDNPTNDVSDKQGVATGMDESVVQRKDKVTGQSKSTFWPLQWTGDESPSKNDFAGEELTSFIMEMTGSRTIDLEHGSLATQRATNRPLKNYGAMIVKDQSAMLADLKALSARKNVVFPNKLKSDLEEDLNALKEVHGEAFDKKFIAMMIKSHKRNVKKLEKATRSSNAEVQVFATKYLPVVQAHLDKIKALRKDN